MSVFDKIKDQLEWRGPGGKAMGHVVLTRREAEELLHEIYNFGDQLMLDLQNKTIDEAIERRNNANATE